MSTYLYCVADNCLLVHPICRLAFWATVTHRVINDHHAQAFIPYIRCYTVSIHRGFDTGIVPQGLKHDAVPLGHALPVARE